MDKERVKAFVDQIFDDMAGSMTAGLAFVGVRTGLFRAMADQGPMEAPQVAEASGLELRYVEEWLKGMVCAGYLAHDPDNQTYELPVEHAFLLASDDTDHFAGGLFAMVPPLLAVAPRVADAFQRGGGVPFEEYGEEGMTALDLINRGNYEHKLVDYWLAAMPDVVEKLHDGADVLDVGCGTGHASLALAKAFPASRFLGIDLHPDSVDQARQSARERELSERLEFAAKPIEELEESPAYDLVLAFDCVHDFTEPVKTLAEIRPRLKSDGTLFIVEPKAGDQLEDNRHAIGTMFYGFSVFHCMTQSLADGGPGLGTCMGPAQTESLAREAGFRHFERLNIKSQVNLFYRAG